MTSTLETDQAVLAEDLAKRLAIALDYEWGEMCQSRRKQLIEAAAPVADELARAHHGVNLWKRAWKTEGDILKTNLTRQIRMTEQLRVKLSQATA